MGFDRVSDGGVFSERITSRVSDAIIGWEFKSGDRLPPERQLAEQFGVGRTVVRDAVQTLSGRGILHVRRGPTPLSSATGVIKVLRGLLSFCVVV